MTVDEAIRAADELAGRIVVIEGYIGHGRPEAEKLRVGMCEPTWIAASPGDQDSRRITLLPSPAYSRPFRFYEMAHGRAGGMIAKEATVRDWVRFCGRVRRVKCDLALDELRWCEISVRDRAEPSLCKPKQGFWWLFAMSPDAPVPNPGVPLAEVLSKQAVVPQKSLRAEGVLIIDGRPDQHHQMHILTSDLKRERDPSQCIRVASVPDPEDLVRIWLNADLENRFPNCRVFRSIVEGSYEPDQTERYTGTLHDLRELVIIPPPGPAPHWPDDVRCEVAKYIFFPGERLRRQSEVSPST